MKVNERVIERKRKGKEQRERERKGKEDCNEVKNHEGRKVLK